MAAAGAAHQQEGRQRQGGVSALAAYLMGAATIGAVLLAKTLHRKLRRRRRVVSNLRPPLDDFVQLCQP